MGHLLRLPLENIEKLERPTGRHAVRLEERRRGHDRAEWITQLVREHRQELIAPSYAVLNLFLRTFLFGHVPEDRADADDLLVGIAQRKPRDEIPRLLSVQP